MRKLLWIGLGALIAGLAIATAFGWLLRKDALYDLRVQFAGTINSWSIANDDDYSVAHSQIIAGILAQQHMVTEKGDQPVIYGHFEMEIDLGVRSPQGTTIISHATSQSPHYRIRRSGTQFTSGSIQGEEWVECARGESLEFVISEALMTIHSNLQHSKKALKQSFD